MNGDRQETTVRPSERAVKNAITRPSWWHRVEERRRARRLQRVRRIDDQRLAQRVLDIIVDLGLTQTNYSMSGGYTLHVPQVVSVITGPLGRLDIRILPGQTTDDFANHAPAIAHRLGAAEVQVVVLGPSLIRLELLAEPA
ncbi:MAG: hypothetical protein ACRDRO_15805 [Pseudonocardiaceae bacterium]